MLTAPGSASAPRSPAGDRFPPRRPHGPHHSELRRDEYVIDANARKKPHSVGPRGREPTSNRLVGSHKPALKKLSVCARIWARVQVASDNHRTRTAGNTCRDLVIEVVLSSERGFDGRDVWDTMHEMGLQWGDGDAFNFPGSGSAEDAAFGVTTTTDPGYFIPEEIITGTSYEDLRFDFHIPTVNDPERTLDMMLEAVHRAQEKLGGTLTVGNNQSLDERRLREEVRDLAEEMRRLGWPRAQRQRRTIQRSQRERVHGSGGVVRRGEHAITD